ncbi:MAG: response regulator [Candidatus Margulisiibacteriota bacterium]
MKVLIADDELENRETLGEIFKSKGFEVIETTDGQAAIERSILKKPDLIILDVMMPKLTGWEACRKLKENKETNNIPVIILTGKTKDIDELMTAEAGADLYIKKPFSPLEVFEQAQQLLGGKK